MSIAVKVKRRLYDLIADYCIRIQNLKASIEMTCMSVKHIRKKVVFQRDVTLTSNKHFVAKSTLHRTREKIRFPGLAIVRANKQKSQNLKTFVYLP